MMIALALASLLATTSAEAQEPSPSESVTRLEEVEVIGRPLDDLIQGFVNEVAAPNRGRQLARWPGPVCVGAGNLIPETAQFVVDRVSTVAEDMGLTPGAPGCRPNILIIATHDPDGMAQQMVEQRRRHFLPGGSGMDRGRSRLNAFQTSDQPVRWWAISMPVDSDTGQRAVRVPGECQGSCSSIQDYAPIISVRTPSQLHSQIVDDMSRVVVIIDMNQMEGVTALQLADYVAMVTLAQIDPQADTGRYASILNVFEDPAMTPSLTDWDLAYLTGLYDADRTRAIPRASRYEVASSIRRAHERLRAEADGDDASR